MKIFFGACLLLIATCCKSSLAYVVTDNGQPTCSTEEEVNVRIFRDNWDPTAYWKCITLNEPAVKERCPDQTAFLDSVKDCVSWDDWKWEEPIAPLSYVNQS